MVIPALTITTETTNTLCSKKHPLTFYFVSPRVMCGFKQKLQSIYPRKGRFWFTSHRTVFNLSFYPRDAILARVIGTATCPSVCPSRAGIVSKRRRASVVISSPSGSPKTLVFWRQISSPNSNRFPPNGSLKQGSVGKIQRFSSYKRQYLENGSRYGQSYY